MDVNTTVDVDAVKAVVVETLGVEDRADALDATTPLFGSLPASTVRCASTNAAAAPNRNVPTTTLSLANGGDCCSYSNGSAAQSCCARL